MLEELSRPSDLKDYLRSRYEDDGNQSEYVPSEEPLATWWQQKTPGTTYWRAQLPARHLPGQSLVLRYSDLKTDEEGRVFMPRQKGAMIAQFVGNATRALLMAHQQEQGTKVLMEVDDNYLHPPPVTGAPSEWARKLDRSQADEYSFQAHRRIVRWVDGIIVATDELADHYERVTEAPIYVCPNSIDLRDWAHVSRNTIEQKGKLRDRRLPGHARSIGYAGSSSHRFDLSLVERALRWASQEPDVTVWKIGANTVEWSFPHREMPWANNLAEYRSNLTRLDIGLCPLKRGEWQDCKSDIKTLEYLLSGVVPIVQNCPPYKEWIDILPHARTDKDWLKQVRWAIRAPWEELADVWQAGYDYLMENKLIEQSIYKWREAVA